MVPPDPDDLKYIAAMPAYQTTAGATNHIFFPFIFILVTQSTLRSKNLN